jgi:hypothetical protein
MKKMRADINLKNRMAADVRFRIQHLYSREHIWELIEEEYRGMMRRGEKSFASNN